MLPSDNRDRAILAVLLVLAGSFGGRFASALQAAINAAFGAY